MYRELSSKTKYYILQMIYMFAFSFPLIIDIITEECCNRSLSLLTVYTFGGIGWEAPIELSTIAKSMYLFIPSMITAGNLSSHILDTSPHLQRQSISIIVLFHTVLTTSALCLSIFGIGIANGYKFDSIYFVNSTGGLTDIIWLSGVSILTYFLVSNAFSDIVIYFSLLCKRFTVVLGMSIAIWFFLMWFGSNDMDPRCEYFVCNFLMARRFSICGSTGPKAFPALIGLIVTSIGCNCILDLSYRRIVKKMTVKS